MQIIPRALNGKVMKLKNGNRQRDDPFSGHDQLSLVNCYFVPILMLLSYVRCVAILIFCHILGSYYCFCLFLCPFFGS